MINGAVIHRLKIGSRANLISTSWWHILAGRNTKSEHFGQLSRWRIIMATMGERIKSNPKEITVGNSTTIRQQHRIDMPQVRTQKKNTLDKTMALFHHPHYQVVGSRDSPQTNFDGSIFIWFHEPDWLNSDSTAFSPYEVMDQSAGCSDILNVSTHNPTKQLLFFFLIFPHPASHHVSYNLGVTDLLTQQPAPPVPHEDECRGQLRVQT